jgi:hypothetical protein
MAPTNAVFKTTISGHVNIRVESADRIGPTDDSLRCCR